MAVREGFCVVGSPFEGDTQLISLMNQSIIDYVVMNNCDMPYQGCTRTILKLSKGIGKCKFVLKSDLLSTFRNRFQSQRELDNNDLSVFACIMGNDYIKRIKGMGTVLCTKKM